MKSMVKKRLASMLAGSCSFWAVAAEKIDTTYNKVEEICDWGAATTKVIIDLKQTVDKSAIALDTFGVFVKRTDSRVTESPLLEQGERKIVKAYTSDSMGNATASGQYVTLELEIGPTVSLGSPLNYYSGSNV